jgi:hypothetical protein
LLHLAARLFAGAFLLIALTGQDSTLLPRGEWLAWVTPVVHAQGTIRAEEPDIFVHDGTRLVNLTYHFGNDIAPTWSQDGRLAWLSNRDGDFDVYVHQGRGTLNISQNDHGDFEPIWSRDGRLAWVSRNRQQGETVYVWDGERVTPAGNAIAIQNRSLAWSSDGSLRWLGLNGLSGTIHVWQDHQRAYIPVEGFVHSLSWSDDGRLLWIDASRAPIGVMVAWDGRATQVIDDDVRNLTQPLWSQRGQVLWSSLDLGRWSVHLWDGQETHQVSPEAQDALAPAWVERAR